MNYRFFHIPAREPDAETAVMNRFFAQHRILSVERHLVVDAQQSFWAISVTYADADTAPGGLGESTRGRKPKVDYKILNQRLTDGEDGDAQGED